jgi:hypothetical protein
MQPHVHPAPPAYALWLIFVWVQFLYWTVKAELTRRSKLSGIDSIWKWYLVNWPALALRFTICLLFFWFWFDQPDAVDHVFDALASKLADGALKSAIQSVSFPLNPATAGLFSIAADSILDKLLSLVPGLKRDVPPVKDASVPPVKD